MLSILRLYLLNPFWVFIYVTGSSSSSIIFNSCLHLFYLLFVLIYCIHFKPSSMLLVLCLIYCIHFWPSFMLLVLRPHLLYSLQAFIYVIGFSSSTIVFILGLHICYWFFVFIDSLPSLSTSILMIFALIYF